VCESYAKVPVGHEPWHRLLMSNCINLRVSSHFSMTTPILNLFIVFLLVATFSYGQSIDRSLYTSVNVFSTKPRPFNAVPYNEFNKLDSSNFLKDYKIKGLTAFITDSTIKSKYYNSNLLIGYFVNNTNDTLLIDRRDEAINKTETQIFINNKWVTFQLNLPSDCGLSYFETKLPPKSYYVLQIPDPTVTDEEIETKFRVKFAFDKKVFYTNAIIVKLTQERIAKTKQKINPHLWN